MPRLVIFTRFYPPFKGGAEIQTSRLALALAEEGVDVLVLTGQGPGQDPEHPRLQIRRLDCNHIRGLGTIIYCLKAFFLGLRFRPTAVLPVLVSDTVLIAWLIAKICQANRFYRVACAGNGSDFASKTPQGRVRLYRRLLRNFHLIAISNDIERELHQQGSSTRVTLIPNGIYIPEQTPPLDHQYIFLALGRLELQKGFDILIHSFLDSGLAAQGWQLLICGEGSQRPQLEALAGNSLGKQILIPGNVSNMDAEWGRCSVFILSSRFEGMSNALLEAMATARPIISTRVSGVADLLIDEESALLIEPENCSALTAALQRLAGSAELRRRLASAAFAAVKLKADLRNTAKSWRQLIEGTK